MTSAFVGTLLAVALCLSATAASAADVGSLRSQVAAQLESQSEQKAVAEQKAEGILNCANKCNKLFDFTAYDITQGAMPQETFEAEACTQGCTWCEEQIRDNLPADNCYQRCKNFPFTPTGLLKGVVEPDKACIFGCTIKLCQVTCTGGGNWPDSGGCAIMTGGVLRPFYSQNGLYSPVGRTGAVPLECCSNAFSLCEYVGPRDANFRDVLRLTQKACNINSMAAICRAFRNECGGGDVAVTTA